MCVRVKCQSWYEWHKVGLWRNDNLFDEPLGKWPIYPQNHFLPIVFDCQGVPEIVVEPRQLWSPTLQCSLDLIIHHTLDLFRHRYLVRLHHQNVNRSGSNMQSSQTLWATSPVLLSTSRSSQTPLEISNVLSDSARAFSGVPESTCRCGGAFRMLRDLTYMIVKFWSSWDLCAALQETSRAAETAAQHTTTRYFVLSYSSLLQSQDSLHHNMACII